MHGAALFAQSQQTRAVTAYRQHSHAPYPCCKPSNSTWAALKSISTTYSVAPIQQGSLGSYLSARTTCRGGIEPSTTYRKLLATKAHVRPGEALPTCPCNAEGSKLRGNSNHRRKHPDCKKSPDSEGALNTVRGTKEYKSMQASPQEGSWNPLLGRLIGHVRC